MDVKSAKKSFVAISSRLIQYNDWTMYQVIINNEIDLMCDALCDDCLPRSSCYFFVFLKISSHLQIVLNLFLFFGRFEPHCSYLRTIVKYSKRHVVFGIVQTALFNYPIKILHSDWLRG